MNAGDMKKVLLLTSTNLACNPRCHKELQLLLEHQFAVTLVAFRLHNWSDAIEKQMQQRYPAVQFHYLETTRQGNPVAWLQAVLIERMARPLARFFPGSAWLQAMAVSRRSWLLLQWARQQDERYDLVIAHNPPAFYPAGWLCRHRGIRYAIDVEDYHPGEDNPEPERQSVARLMRQLLPGAFYNSYAAPLIRDYSLRLLSNVNPQQHLVLNNCFPASAFRLPERATGSVAVKLIWFSQVVDFRRGLENLLPALDRFPEGSFELTLIGDLRKGFYEQELRRRSYIKCLPAMPQDDLLQQLSAYDVGLALENNAADLNRNLCLTNKIWSYFQAGLFILASGTDAQKAFMDQHPRHGISSSRPDADVYPLLQEIRNRIATIRAEQAERFDAARACSWERESASLLQRWQALNA